MNTLNVFSEKEAQYHQYQARQEYLREQRTIQLELEQAVQKLEQIERELEQERQAKQMAMQREAAALEKLERLKTLLAKNDNQTH